MVIDHDPELVTSLRYLTQVGLGSVSVCTLVQVMVIDQDPELVTSLRYLTQVGLGSVSVCPGHGH